MLLKKNDASIMLFAIKDLFRIHIQRRIIFLRMNYRFDFSTV